MSDISKSEIYVQQYAHFGRMNDILYKMPPIFSTILGGLWFFGASYLDKDKPIAVGVFLFSGVTALCFLVACERFRVAFNAYIDNINQFDGAHKVSLRASCWPSTLSALILLVKAAVLFSVMAAAYAVYK